MIDSELIKQANNGLLKGTVESLGGLFGVDDAYDRMRTGLRDLAWNRNPKTMGEISVGELIAARKGLIPWRGGRKRPGMLTGEYRPITWGSKALATFGGPLAPFGVLGSRRVNNPTSPEVRSQAAKGIEGGVGAVDAPGISPWLNKMLKRFKFKGNMYNVRPEHTQADLTNTLLSMIRRGPLSGSGRYDPIAYPEIDVK